MPLKWTAQMEETLLSLVSQEEALWNPQHPGYTRRHFISETWSVIGDKLGVQRKF